QLNAGKTRRKGRGASSLVPSKSHQLSATAPEGALCSARRCCSYRREKSSQLAFIQLPIRPHSRAQIQPKRCDRGDRLANIALVQSSCQKNRHAHAFANLAAQPPVVASPGTAQFLHGE